MSRMPRVEYPDAINNVMSRANGKGAIFESDGQEDRAIEWGWCPGTAHFRAGLPDRLENKLAKAARPRRETTSTLELVAERLHMGTWRPQQQAL